jgi:4-amino-4-deoxy-L-arabinose transferase-like glycosyltransferase
MVSASFSFLPRRSDRAVLALILGFLAFRFILAVTLGFTVDESYSIANARDLSLSYFDHPPLHYWIVHAFMPILGEGHAARLPFVLLFSVSSWLLYLLTRPQHRRTMQLERAPGHQTQQANEDISGSRRDATCRHKP